MYLEIGLSSPVSIQRNRSFSFFTGLPVSILGNRSTHVIPHTWHVFPIHKITLTYILCNTLSRSGCPWHEKSLQWRSTRALSRCLGSCFGILDLFTSLAVSCLQPRWEGKRRYSTYMLDNIQGILLGPALLGRYTDHIGEAICIRFWISQPIYIPARRHPLRRHWSNVVYHK
jgi:hypothetical protein